MNEAYKVVLKDLREKRARIDELIAALLAFNGDMPPEEDAPDQKYLNAIHDAPFNNEAAVIVLKKLGTVRSAQINEEFTRAGRVIPLNSSRTLLTGMQKAGYLKRVETGVYRLAKG